jgi:hypothetical protein
VARDIAALMRLSPQTVTTLFEHELGVIVMERKRCGKRAYRSIRVPRGVYEHFLRKHSVRGVNECNRDFTLTDVLALSASGS